jgi:hypothetical protein
MSRTIVVIVCALAALVLASCATPQSRLLGKWNISTGLGGYIEFKADGRYTWDMLGTTQQGTWRIEKKELRMSMESMTFSKSIADMMPSSSGELNMDKMMKDMPKVEGIYSYTLKGKDLTIQSSMMKDISLTFHKQ